MCTFVYPHVSTCIYGYIHVSTCTYRRVCPSTHVHIHEPTCNNVYLRIQAHIYINLLVELLSKDEVGGGASDGDEPADGGSVGDAERQAFADHVIPLGGILGVSPGFDALHIWELNRNLREREENIVN